MRPGDQWCLLAVTRGTAAGGTCTAGVDFLPVPRLEAQGQGAGRLVSWGLSVACWAPSGLSWAPYTSGHLSLQGRGWTAAGPPCGLILVWPHVHTSHSEAQG